MRLLTGVGVLVVGSSGGGGGDATSSLRKRLTTLLLEVLLYPLLISVQSRNLDLTKLYFLALALE